MSPRTTFCGHTASHLDVQVVWLSWPGGHDACQRLQHHAVHLVSDLALTEVASALARRMRERRLTHDEAERLYREASRLKAGSRSAESTPSVHRRAERLMLSLEIPLRALDALHVATALDADAATVVTFDPRLRAAARSQGLFVAPPAENRGPEGAAPKDAQTR